MRRLIHRSRCARGPPPGEAGGARPPVAAELPRPWAELPPKTGSTNTHLEPAQIPRSSPPPPPPTATTHHRPSISTMKSIACVLALVASASAYQAPTMMAKRGKAAPAPAPAQVTAAPPRSSRWRRLAPWPPPPRLRPPPHPHLQPRPHAPTSPLQGVRSAALPFTTAPPSLDGSMIGDVGFDPLGLSMNTDCTSPDPPLLVVVMDSSCTAEGPSAVGHGGVWGGDG